jgi:trafficking protein particle complex subunit 8
MKKTFGTNVSQITINSLSYEQAAVVGTEQTFLSLGDIDGLRLFMKDLLFRHVIPHLDNKLRSLEDHVAMTRKNVFTSKVRSFFRFGQARPRQTGENGAPELTSTGIRIYPMNSTMAQTRQLADLSFLLRDYDSALLNYKNCAAEMKTDLTTRYLASATEMAALCSAIIDTHRRDCEGELERARALYVEAGRLRYADRTTLLLIAMKKMRSRYTEAASVAVRDDSKRSALLSGLLQEQAAICYLYKWPSPMFRMANMRLVMAADKFYEAGQLAHALSCVRSAAPAYDGKGWASLGNHVYFLLARSAFLLGDTESSCRFAYSLLQETSQSPERQSSFLREFLHVYGISWSRDGCIRESPVPEICGGGDNLQVHLRCVYATEKDKVWRLLEDWVAHEEGREKARSAFRFFGVPRDHLHTAFKSNVSPVMERIEVEVTVRNPLAIPIQLLSCQLVCDHFGPEEDFNVLGTSSPSLSEEESFSVEPVDVLMLPFQTITLSLSVTPLREGLLEIRGLLFSLAGVVWCNKPFPLRKHKLQNTKAQRVAGEEVDLSTSIQVVGPMPHLTLGFPRFPSFMYQGEVQRFTVSFTNTGTQPLENVAVKLSHPGMFVFGDSPHEPAVATFAPSEVLPSPTMSTGSVSDEYDLSIIHLPIGQLAVGETTQVPLWVRGSKTVNQQCRFVFYYEPVDKQSEIKYRVCREEVRFGVVPSLRASYWVTPSLRTPSQYTLGVQLHGVQAATGFRLLQATSVGHQWKIDSLSFTPESNPTDMFEIQPSESSTLYLTVSRTTPLDLHPDCLTYCNLPLVGKYAIDGAAQPFAEILTRLRRPNPISFNTNFTTLRDFTPPPITSLVDPAAMDMLIFWESLDAAHHGVLELCDLHFLPPASVKETSVPRGAVGTRPLPSGRRRTMSSGIDKQLQLQLDDHNRLVTNPLRFMVSSQMEVRHNFGSDTFVDLSPLYSIY